MQRLHLNCGACKFKFQTAFFRGVRTAFCPHCRAKVSAN